MASFSEGCSADDGGRAMLVKGGNPGFYVHTQNNVTVSEEEGPRG